jgi:hypothetical protein
VDTQLASEDEAASYAAEQEQFEEFWMHLRQDA